MSSRGKSDSTKTTKPVEVRREAIELPTPDAHGFRRYTPGKIVKGDE